MKIIIYATHSFGTFETLKKHPDVVIVGFGTKWRGFIERANVILAYLSTLPDDEIVVIIDGFDTYIKKTEGLQEEFQNMNCKVLVSLNNSGLPNIINNYTAYRIFGYCKDKNTANAGLMMGYVEHLKIVWNQMKGPSDDDQRNLNIACKYLTFLKIDVNNTIFENGSIDRVQSSSSYFYQTPYNLSFSRIIRSVSEYYEYFIPEIISIFVLSILYYNRKNIRKLNKRYYK